jgi:hypothetical protein
MPPLPPHAFSASMIDIDFGAQRDAEISPPI